MYSLTVQEAIEAVRKNLDEIGLNESVMYDTESTDNESLDQTIARSLPEAINRIHLAAPVTLLEGENYLSGFYDIDILDGVLTFSFAAPYLRLVAFQAEDSAIVVTEAIPESSAEGRKQLNKYVRGRYDRPRLVKEQDANGRHTFFYYSLKDNFQSPRDAIKRFSFVKEQFYDGNATSYPVSPALRQNAIDTLTAMVLAIYGENEKANYFSDKAKPI